MHPQRSFYVLQEAGLCVSGSEPDTITYLYNTVLLPVIKYRLHCIYHCRGVMDETENVQYHFC